MPLSDTETRILLVLLKHGEQPVRNIPKLASVSPSVLMQNISRLLEKKLITERREDVFPRRRLISLTEKGRRVAEHLAEVEKILEDS